MSEARNLFDTHKDREALIRECDRIADTGALLDFDREGDHRYYEFADGSSVWHHPKSDGPDHIYFMD